MDGVDEPPKALAALSGPPPTRKSKPRVRAQIYQVAGTTEYRARPPAGEIRSEWADQVRAALGTTSTPFADAALHRLLAAATLPGQIIPTSTAISAALALIQSMEPENELQAALAVDVACLHAASTNILSRIRSHDVERRLMNSVNAAAKLERAFHSAVDTYYRVKRGNTQVIRVEKMVVESGGQAMVGQVLK